VPEANGNNKANKRSNYHIYNSPYGAITIVSDGSAITALWLKEIPVEDGINEKDALIDRARKQLDEYFAGNRREFDLPLSPYGTDFQQAVWKELLAIPYGETRSYGQVAQNIGKPKACRAVGMANNKNPISVVIPCHRVIGADGSLTGYGGGLEMKRKLLDLEKGPTPSLNS
jgi:methylated-DNA-[protein]-cysteine S-methyltransferase